MYRYVIEYFDKSKGERVRYLNNTSFPNATEAEEEIVRLKKVNKKEIAWYGCTQRRNFKVVPVKIKQCNKET